MAITSEGISFDDFAKIMSYERHALSNRLQVIGGWMQMGDTEQGLQIVRGMIEQLKQDTWLSRVASPEVFTVICMIRSEAEAHGLSLRISVDEGISEFRWPKIWNQHLLQVMHELFQQVSIRGAKEKLVLELRQEHPEFIWRLTLGTCIPSREFSTVIDHFAQLDRTVSFSGGRINVTSFIGDDGGNHTIFEIHWPRNCGK